MATKKKLASATMESADDGRVTVTVPRARRGEAEDLYVCLNGVNYLIPKGKAVRVPPEVAAEIERAAEAEERFHEAAEELQNREG